MALTRPQGNIVMKLGTEQASTSGTAIDFTGIPAGTTMIIIQLFGVSTNGTSPYLVQLGDAGGFETTGYLGGNSYVGSSSAGANSTAGLLLTSGAAVAVSIVCHGSVILTLEDSTQFSWVGQVIIGRSDDAFHFFGAASKSLTQELSQVRITTANGTDAFDAGAINIAYF